VPANAPTQRLYILNCKSAQKPDGKMAAEVNFAGGRNREAGTEGSKGSKVK
jgi:hypothetical protein